MPSSFTTRNRLTKQATGENTNTWGIILNAVLDLMDSALDGVTTISAGGATTLTTANGSSDEARRRILNITATTAATITIPSLEKWYIVRNASSSVDHVITNGASSVTIYAGERVFVLTDGTTVWKAQALNMGGQRLQNLGAPTSNADAATKLYVDSQAFESVELPGQTGNGGKYVGTDGTNASWSYPLGSAPATRITANTTAVSGGRYECDTTGGAFTLTLPASPSEGDRVEFWDGGVTDTATGFLTNNLTVARNGSTINSVADDLVARKAGGKAVMEYENGTWRVHL